MNYKRLKSSVAERTGCRMRAGARVFVLLAGVEATAIGILQAAGIAIAPEGAIAGCAGIFVASCISAVATKTCDYLPDTILPADDTDGAYALSYETADDCAHFNQEGERSFGRNHIADSMVELWRRKNPEGFLCLKNSRNELCGAFCIFALTTSFMEQFTKGRVSESDINDSDILDHKQSLKANALYVGAIIVHDPRTPVGHRRALVLLWSMAWYIQSVYGSRRKRTLFAVPVTTASVNLVKRLGFTIACPASGRKDRHDLYSLHISRESIQTVISRIGDYSKSCLTPFKQRSSVKQRAANKRREEGGGGPS